jgi:hypothetical protein
MEEGGEAIIMRRVEWREGNIRVYLLPDIKEQSYSSLF